jgi:HEPN domain-containing protein
MKSDTQQWLDIAATDYGSSLYLFKGAYYPQAVYFLCQAVEKLLKAALIELAGRPPVKTHQLESLARKTRLPFSEAYTQILKDLTRHYGRVRYPDYARTFYNTRAKVEPIINQGKEVYQWILTTLNNP